MQLYSFISILFNGNYIPSVVYDKGNSKGMECCDCKLRHMALVPYLKSHVLPTPLNEYLIRPSTLIASLSLPLSAWKKNSFALIADKEIDVPHFPVGFIYGELS